MRPSLCLKCLTRHCEHGSRRPSHLTHRQMELLVELANGKSNAAIAEAIGLSESAIKVYLQRIYRTLGFHNRLQAGLWAKDHLTALRGEEAAA